MRKLILLSVCAGAVLAFSSCKDDDPAPYDSSKSPLMKIMDNMMARMDSMSMTHDPDYDFAKMMRIHHHGAVEMSEYELSSGSDATTRGMAQTIKTDQLNEIAVMDSFINVHTPVMNMNAGMAFMEASMAADEKMAAETKAQVLNGDADHDFVKLMIPHHKGAIEMAEAEVQYGQIAEMREMAQRMIDAQQEEVSRFQEWLNNR